MIQSIVDNRISWPSMVNPIQANQVPLNLVMTTPPVVSQTTGLSQLGGTRFTGDNQTKDTRRPQGIATYNELIIVSWYFRSSTNLDNCKLTITNPLTQTSKDVVPLECVGGQFFHIDSHAGGISVVGDYLYIADSSTNSLRVFDLRYFYNRLENANFVANEDSFANIYEYFLPQVGQIFLATPGGAPVSYMSTNSQEFLVGNFYDPNLGAEYAVGGKSMIWRMPVTTDPAYEFPVPGEMSQIDPEFPTGATGDTLTRIQGALLIGDILIINRSWSTATKQLIVMHLTDPDRFFCGTAENPQIHVPDNWLYGCEGICLGNDPETVLVVTEFINERNITKWSLNAVLGLLGGTMTVLEHQLELGDMLIRLSNLAAEISYYELQISSAMHEGLTEFDAATYEPIF